jgi:hypothetical protein
MLLVILFLSSLSIVTSVYAACPQFELPWKNTTYSSTKLPNPFKFKSGENVTSKADWKCRRAEISALLQQIELGDLPPKPSVLNASITGNTLLVRVEENGRQISFTASFKLPTNATGPFPVVIALGGASIPLNGTGPLAQMVYNNDQIAQQSTSTSRGHGGFYTLYGSNHSAGALIAWTWGLSRIIDALELLGPEVTKIDTKRIAITGCSRNGKGTLAIGAFEERISLTIPQEAGVGAAAIWRMYNDSICRRNCIPSEPPWVANVWFRQSFPPADFTTLPYDNHELVGMVAPRGLYIIENDIDWSQPAASVVGAKAGKMIYEALGVTDKMGFSLKGGHAHCSFPSPQYEELNAFLDKFLFGKETNTDIWKTDINADTNNYIDWKTPVLE